MAGGDNATVMTALQTRGGASSTGIEPPGDERKQISREDSAKRRHRLEVKGAMDLDGLEEEAVGRRGVGEGSGTAGMAGRRWRKVKNVISMSSSLLTAVRGDSYTDLMDEGLAAYVSTAAAPAASPASTAESKRGKKVAAAGNAMETTAVEDADKDVSAPLLRAISEGREGEEGAVEKASATDDVKAVDCDDSSDDAWGFMRNLGLRQRQGASARAGSSQASQAQQQFTRENILNSPLQPHVRLHGTAAGNHTSGGGTGGVVGGTERAGEGEGKNPNIINPTVTNPNATSKHGSPDLAQQGFDAAKFRSPSLTAAASRERDGHGRPKKGQFRPRGRSGMAQLKVSYDMSLYCWFTDIYVTCLKMPLYQFFIALSAAPSFLALLFTPLFLLTLSGLHFEDGILSPIYTPSPSSLNTSSSTMYSLTTPQSPDIQYTAALHTTPVPHSPPAPLVPSPISPSHHPPASPALAYHDTLPLSDASPSQESDVGRAWSQVTDVISAFKHVKTEARRAAASATASASAATAASAATEGAAGGQSGGARDQPLPPVSDVMAAIQELKASKRASRPLSTSILRFLASCALRTALTVLHVFLYSLSLSTTFGGSPVSATSPVTLLLANINTLLAQFLFVFLSGAVFARMSQPSNPITFSKKAIVRESDYEPYNPTASASAAATMSSSPSISGISFRSNVSSGSSVPESLGDSEEGYRALATRLVLSGPHPSELVDVKLFLSLRYFHSLPDGSVFCSVRDLALVRSEVPYMRFGMTVRHIIDETSPLYNHTAQSLFEGDAAFSLTVSGTDRTSMQPVFDMQEYFVYDGDVIWGADFSDIVTADAHGNKVIDHSKLDCIKVLPLSALASQGLHQPALDRRRFPDTDDVNAASKSKREVLPKLHRTASGSLSHLVATLPKAVSCVVGGIMSACSRRLPESGSVGDCQSNVRENKLGKTE